MTPNVTRPRTPDRWSLLSLSLLLTAGLGAGCTCNPEKKGDFAPDDEARTLMLGVDTEFAELEIPLDSRGDLGRPPERIPLRGWSSGSEEGATVAVTDLPIRTRNLYFFKPSPGMKVVRADGTELPHRYTQAQPPFWTYDADKIRVRGLEGLPGDGDLFLVYENATEREASLNQQFSGKEKEVFARATVQAGAESRSGLLLPAPARAAWEIDIPPSADLRFAAALIRPEVLDGPPSDGAKVTVRLDVEGQSHEVWTGNLKRDVFEPVRIDLGPWARKHGRLTVVTDPGATPRFDYVFLADPVIASRKAHPRRVFMVFVDTLRVDHMSAFGYERETTPNLDRLAARSVKLTQARNVAPWTLPSTRSVLTGVDPEFYFDAPTLQGRLREAGFATAMFAGNIYLSSNFGLNRDWGLHNVELLPRANTQLDKAMAWLKDNEGRDLMLLLHLMDCHLPYKEPKEYRRKFAGEPPATLKREEFHRDHVMQAHLKTKEDRQYVRDRYDNNILYADDQLAQLYELVGPDDIVVFFSDHGEEFWDHGGFEHGHTLYDELLRVPLIVHGPGLSPATLDAPVSLLDVAPTVLDLLGMEASGMKGTSLVALMSGDRAADQALRGRAQAFGRPLYGGERWGVIDGTTKYTTFNGAEWIYDLAADPEERKSSRSDAQATELRGAMGTALSREVMPAWRIAPRGGRKFPDRPLKATIHVPGGIRAAWVGEDPTEASWAELDWKPGANEATITWPTGYRGSRDVWIVPTQPITDASPTLSIDAVDGDTTVHVVPSADAPRAPQGERGLMLSAEVGERTLDVGFGFMPIPDPKARATSGFDPELSGQLEAMGYVVGAGEDKRPADKKPEDKPAEDPKKAPAKP